MTATLPLRFCAALILAALLDTSFATDYYVAKSGSDGNDGSQGRPWLTLTKAVSTVAGNAGHVIHLGAGTFSEGTIAPASGTTIAGAGVGATTIATSSGMVIDGRSAITLRDFTIDAQNAAIKILKIYYSDHVNVYNVDLNNGEDGGLNISHSQNVLVDGGTYNEAGGRGTGNGDKDVIGLNYLTDVTIMNVTVIDA